MVGAAVSRRAQEFLHGHEIVVLQNVKSSLLARVARMTGATILSTDQIASMAALNGDVTGECGCFQMVEIADEWALKYADKATDIDDAAGDRPAATAAAGGATAPPAVEGARRHVKRVRGRGASNFAYLAGCPAALGCTLLLRGESKAALRKVKRVVRFALAAAYHLRLEVAYLHDSGAELPDASLAQEGESGALVHSDLLSSSLAVRFRESCDSDLPETTAFDHQQLLVSTVWMASSQSSSQSQSQCSPARVQTIPFYTPQDVCLGKFLFESCFSTDFKLAATERKSVQQLFHHRRGRLTFSVLKLEPGLPNPLGNVASSPKSTDSATQLMQRQHAHLAAAVKEALADVGLVGGAAEAGDDRQILMWSYCKRCARIVTPLAALSEESWKMSFGKFLEIS
ncbi:hypothetical protein M885DRAFT_210762 [Pelagophyceae sp. CCMP2097]|nr:hypothetical protein M885DRAFT_210762 [Pelagophyceae sp. CCMP2097]